MKNIPKLIQDNVELDINNLYTMEENINKIYESNKTPNLSNKTNFCLFSVYDNIDTFVYLDDIKVLKDMWNRLGLNGKVKIIITGPFIRSILVKNKLENINRPVTIHLYSEACISIDSSEIIKNNILIDQKKYVDNIHTLLSQPNWYDRLGFDGEHLLASSVFLAEYNKIKLNIGKMDPILNYSRDYLNINNITRDIYDLIKTIDIAEIINLKNIQYECGEKNPIEYALSLYIAEKNDMLKKSYKIIIELLANYTYVRSPNVMFNYYNIKDPDLTLLFDKIPCKYDFTKSLIIDKNTNINKVFIVAGLKHDNDMFIEEYLKLYKCEIELVKYIVKYNSRKCLKKLMELNKINMDNAIYCILLTEAIDYFSNIDKKYIYNKGKEILKEIINNNKVVSLYYLYKIDKTILDTLFENNNNISHIVTKSSQSILKLIIKLNKTLLMLPNNSGSISLLTLVNNDTDIFLQILENVHNIIVKDNSGNNILHYISIYGKVNLLNIIYPKYKSELNTIINAINNIGETPILLACKNGYESLYYAYIKIGADPFIKDEHGNICDHYICLNKICLGLEISNIPNNYHMIPVDYSNINHKFWRKNTLN